jgi:hypothetical protein
MACGCLSFSTDLSTALIAYVTIVFMHYMLLASKRLIEADYCNFATCFTLVVQ